jgi:hypothetical protein
MEVEGDYKRSCRNPRGKRKVGRETQEDGTWNKQATGPCTYVQKFWRNLEGVRSGRCLPECIATDLLCEAQTMSLFSFQAHSQNCEKRLLASSFLSVRME